MSTAKIGLSIFLALFISIACSSALSEGFEAYSPVKDIAACSHSLATNSITITNTGDVESFYSLSGIGTISASYSETSFSLKPGESKPIFIYFSSIAPGNYYLETIIRTNFGLEKAVRHNIISKNCENIEVSVQNPVVKINPCELAHFKFNIKNTGDYAELYQFSTSGFSDYTKLSADSILLAPGESAQIDLFVNPDCGEYGEKRIKFQALAAASKYLAEAYVYLDIARKYDYSVIMPENVNICNLKQSLIPLQIANNVPMVNQYEIDAGGPSWIRAEAKKVQLDQYKNGITNLIAEPMNPGSYLAEVELKSVRGNVIKKGVLNISVEKCYAPKINIESAADIIVAGKSSQYSVVIKNEGTKADSYSFELTAPEFVSMNAGKISLNAGEEKTITIAASPGINITGVYQAAVNIISSETSAARKDVIMLRVVSDEEAYDLGISVKDKRILYGKDNAAVALHNKGVLPATYSLVLNSPKWAVLDTKNITLEPGSKKIVHIETNAGKNDEQGDYEMQLVANVDKEDIGFVSGFVIKLREITLKQELVLLAKKYLYFVIAGAVVLAGILFVLIFGRRIARRYRNWKIKRKEIAKIKAEEKAKKKEEEQARKLLKKAAKEARPRGKGSKTIGIILVLIALILLAGAALSIAGYTSFIPELLKAKKEKMFEPIIRIDAEGLESFGNTIIIRGEETAIPIIVSNSHDSEIIFGVEIENDWITTDTTRIELEPGEEEKINLIVSPDEETRGTYKISIAATLEKDNKLYKEDVVLNVKKGNLLEEVLNYAWYFAGGLVILIIGLVLSRKKIKPKAEKKEEGVFSKLRYRPLRRINISLPKKR